MARVWVAALLVVAGMPAHALRGPGLAMASDLSYGLPYDLPDSPGTVQDGTVQREPAGQKVSAL